MAGSAEQLPPLRTAPDPRGPWDAVREDLASSGSALVYCTLGGWAGQLAEPPRFRPVLGRDWPRYQSLSHPRAQERFLASRLLLRQAAAAAIETGPELVDLAYQPGGRPYVRGCDQIDISLSHTEEVVVVGVTRRGRIGVDVELADRRMAGTGSERQGFTRYELDRVDEGDAGLRNDTLGQGLRFRFTEFGFALDGAEARLVQPGGEPVRGGSAWTFGTFALEQRYVVSVAVHDAGFGDSVDLSVGTALDEGLLDALLRASERI
jgi:4'-phosphopantetheinyl transferase